MRRGLWDCLFPVIRNMVSVNTSRGTDRVRSGRDKRVIVTVIQVILQANFNYCSCCGTI